MLEKPKPIACRKCGDDAYFSHWEVYPTGSIYDVFECENDACETAHIDLAYAWQAAKDLPLSIQGIKDAVAVKENAKSNVTPTIGSNLP